jgi:hypothetical protein
MRGIIVPAFLIFLAGAVFGSALIGWGIWKDNLETGKSLAQEEAD